MAKRPINEKRAARMRKAMTRKPLPGYIDLVKWLRQHGHAQTAGAARDLILDKRVKIDSHVVGVATEPRLDAAGKVKDTEVVDRYIPVERFKGVVRVVAA